MDNSSEVKPFRRSIKVGQYLKILFNRFNEQGIRYCVLNSYERLPEYSASDVDMAVDSDGLLKVEPILIEIGHQTGLKVIQKLYYDIPSSYYYIIFFRDADDKPGFIQLDFTCDRFGIGKYKMNTKTLLEGRRRYRGFYIPAAPVEACYLLTKRIIKQILDSDDRIKLRRLIAEAPEECRTFFCKRFGRRNLTRIRMLIDNDVSEKEMETFRVLKRTLTYRDQLFRPHLIPLRAFWLSKRILARVVRPTGLCVALLSPDGGGKTAIASQLLSRLENGFRKTKRIHWRPYLLPSPHKLLNPRKWREEEPPNKDPHGLPPKGRAVSTIRFLYYVADYVLGYLPKIWWARVRTTLVISERYYYDFLVDLARYRLDVPAWLPRKLVAVIPRPDLVIILDGPPEVILERKQEISLDEIKRQLRAIRALDGILPNPHWVNVDQGFESEVANVENFIVSALAKRLQQRGIGKS